MKLSIHQHFYFIFLMVTLAIISQIGWTQNQSEQYGLSGIERDGDNVKLNFVFCTPAQSECQRQTLTDDDGLASIVAVLSELKREYICSGEGVTNADDEVPHWDQISNFIEDRIIQLQDYCHESVCRSDSRAILEVHGTDKPDVYLMEYCGEVIRESEKAFETLFSNNKPTYRDLNSLTSLLDKAPYNLYDVSGQRTAKSIIGELGQNSVVVGPIAEHHRSVQIFGARGSRYQYFVDGIRRENYNSGGRSCGEAKSGRLAGLISNSDSRPVSNTGSQGTR